MKKFEKQNKKRSKCIPVIWWVAFDSLMQDNLLIFEKKDGEEDIAKQKQTENCY